MLATDTAVSNTVALLRSHRLFAETDLEGLTRLVGRGQMLALHRGDLLIQHGNESEAAYVLVEGWATVRIDTGYGAVHLSTVSAPALVGEIGVFMGVTRTATIEAAAPLRALRIASADLQRFGRENPAFLAAVMMQVGRRFQALNNAIGFYSSALAALRHHDFDLRLLDELKTPPAELADFTHSFRRLAEEITERRAHREEMASAAAIQRTMLPATIPAISGVALDLFAHMLPAREVGGDFYDYLLLDDHHLAITIGDVSGKGVPAALYMAAAQTALRVALRQQPMLDRAVATANDLLVTNNREAMFASLFCAVIDLRDGGLVASNCGQLSPFILRRKGGWDRIPSSNPALGLKVGLEFKTVATRLGDGDLIFLSTDGLIDSRNSAGDAYGEHRIEQLVSGLPTASAKKFVLAALDAVTNFAGEAPQFDDLTLLAFIYRTQ